MLQTMALTQSGARPLADGPHAWGQSQGARPSEGDQLWDNLVDRMRRNDPSAFETALTLTRGPAWRLACHMLGDPHLAQDALQEAWIVVVTRLHTLRDAQAFRSWFLNIVLNTCRSTVRARTRRPIAAADAPEPTQSGFEDRVTRQMSVATALAELTEIERSAILLRDYLQLSYQEMSSVLGVPLGTVKSRLCEARKHLVHRLKGVDAQ